MNLLISFGRNHRHEIKKTVYDSNCLARIECDSREHGEKIANEAFGDKWLGAYEEEKIIHLIRLYSRGVVLLKK